MMSRSFGLLCSFVLAWIVALGAGTVRHSAAPALLVRGAVELALRDVAEAPLLAPRAGIARPSSAHRAERDAPSSRLATPVAIARAFTPRDPGVSRKTLARQEEAYADRSRWRAYDAAAPPALSRTAR